MCYVIALNLHLINQTQNIHKERLRHPMLRRSGENRRKFDDPSYKGVEKRSGNDRRAVIDRRKSASTDIPR